MSKNSERVGRRHAVCEREKQMGERRGQKKKEMEKEEENSETILSQRILFLI